MILPAVLAAGIFLFILTGLSAFCCLRVSSRCSRTSTDAEQLEFLRNYRARIHQKGRF